MSLLISVTHWLLSLADFVFVLANQEGISILKCHLKIVLPSEFSFITSNPQILIFDLPSQCFGSDSLAVHMAQLFYDAMAKLLYGKVNITFLFLFFSQMRLCFMCSVKLKTLIMDEASKYLDS